jgi:hypothetical protein
MNKRDELFKRIESMEPIKVRVLLEAAVRVLPEQTGESLAAGLLGAIEGNEDFAVLGTEAYDLALRVAQLAGRPAA